MYLQDHLLKNHIDIHNISIPACGQKQVMIENIPALGNKFSFNLHIHEQYGRFGNNIIQILNAAIISKIITATNFTCVYRPTSHCGDKISLGSETLHFNVRSHETGSSINGSFFFPIGFEQCFMNLSARDLRNIAIDLRTGLFPHQEVRKKSENHRIAIHFRGGDVFPKGSPAPNTYVQPPLAYYIMSLRHALSISENAEIFLVYGDFENPCLRRFEEFLLENNIKYQHQSAHYEADFIFLASCDTIITSVGTFCEAAAMLNPGLSHWYSFRKTCSHNEMKPFVQSRLDEILNDSGTEIHIVHDSSYEYIPKGCWNALPEQINTMLTYDIDKLYLNSKFSSTDKGWLKKVMPRVFRFS